MSLQRDLKTMQGPGLVPVKEGKLLWEKAARLNFNLRRRGINVPLMDILIGSWAVVHDCVLVHQDRHLELVKNVEPALETVVIPSQGLPPDLPARDTS